MHLYVLEARWPPSFLNLNRLAIRSMYCPLAGTRFFIRALASLLVSVDSAHNHTPPQAVTYGPAGFRPRAHLAAHYVTDSVCLLPLILPDTAGFLPVASGPSLSAVLVLRCSVPAAKGTGQLSVSIMILWALPSGPGGGSPLVPASGSQAVCCADGKYTMAAHGPSA